MTRKENVNIWISLQSDLKIQETNEKNKHS